MDMANNEPSPKFLEKNISSVIIYCLIFCFINKLFHNMSREFWFDCHAFMPFEMYHIISLLITKKYEVKKCIIIYHDLTLIYFTT